MIVHHSLSQQGCLRDIMHHGILFALHPAMPYVTCVRQLPHASVQTAPAGKGLCSCDYLSELQKLYAPHYPGPSTIGVWWQEPERQVLVDVAD